jgi:multidrug resistance efflux pump
MSEVRNRVVEQSAPIPFRAAEGLQITATSKAKGGAQTHYIRSGAGDIVELGEEEYFIFALLDGNPSFAVIQREFKTRFAGELSRRHFQELMNELLSAGIVKQVAAARTAKPEDSASPAARTPPEPLPPARDATTAEVPATEQLAPPVRDVSLQPLFKFLALLGSPARYFAWLLIPAIPAAGYLLFGAETRIAATLDWTAPGIRLDALGALVAVLLIPAIARGTAAAYHGAPREAFRFGLSAWFLPRFPVDPACIDALPRAGRAASYAAPLLVRLGLFVAGTALWASHHDDPRLAVAGLLIGGLGLCAFLLTALPLWPGDGGRWLAACFDAPAAGRGYLAAGIAIWLFAVAGIASPWIGKVHAVPWADVLGACLTGVAYAAMLGWLKLAAVEAGPLHRPSGFARRGPGVPTAFVPSAAFGRDMAGGGAASLADRVAAGSDTWAPIRSAFIFAIIFAIVISIIFLPYPYESGGSFTVLPFDRYALLARVNGEVTEVLVREGDWVQEGQVVGTLSDWNEAHQLAVQEAELDQAQANLQNLLISPKPEEVIVAQRQYEQALSRIPYSKSEYERDLALVKNNDVSFKTFEQALSTYQQDQAAVAVTKANYDYVRVGPTEAQIAAARAVVQRAADQVAFWRDQLGRTRIRATASGQVVTPDPQLMMGQFLQEGATFISIEDHRVAHLEVQVPETDIRDIHLGSLVRAKAWGYEHTTWLGNTVLIAPDAQPNQTMGNVVRVVAEIPNPDGLLRPTMSGDAKVETVDMPVWVSYTRAVMRFLLIEVWYWIP